MLFTVEEEEYLTLLNLAGNSLHFKKFLQPSERLKLGVKDRK